MCFITVPKKSEFLNRTILVGNMTGRIGVLTWNGQDSYQEDGNKEGILHNVWLKQIYVSNHFSECKLVWEKLMHDGPIISIKRNIFYPDIHIVCGGHLVSIWSLKYLVSNNQRRIVE